MANFPPLRIAVLNGLIGLKDHIDTLDADDCPYDNETKEALKRLLAPVIVEKTVEKEVQVQVKAGRGRPSKDIRLSEDDQLALLTDIKSSLLNLRTLENSPGMDTNAKIQVAKTRTGLLDQLLKMQERHYTVTKMQHFIDETVAILNDLVTESDREIFMKRLDQFR